MFTNLLWLFINPLLSGEFTPIQKEVKKNITINLSKPKIDILNKVNGFYGQIGPSPTFYNQSDNYHLFDGNGMIQGVFINKSTITFQNHWVRTDKFNFENIIKSKLPVRMENFYKNNNFLLYPLFYFLEKLNMYPNMMGTANTALWKGFIGKKWKKNNCIDKSNNCIDKSNNCIDKSNNCIDKSNNCIDKSNNCIDKSNNEIIYALHERDKPYMIDIDFKNTNINTIGKVNIDTEYFTAHPRTFGNSTYICIYNTFKPEVIIYEYDQSFKLKNYKKIKTKYANMIHDIAVTENYIIFIDMPFKFNSNNILKGKNPFLFDSNEKNRIILVNRNLSSNDNDSVQSIECNETFFIFHFNKFYEINNNIILDTIIHPNFNIDLSDIEYNNIAKYRRIIIDKNKLTYKIEKKNVFENINVEFPVSNNKYSVLAILGKGLDINGFIVVKDFQYIKKKILINRKIYGELSITETDCVICFTYDKNLNNYLYIYDIKADKEVEIKLDVQLIKGFHSIFIKK